MEQMYAGSAYYLHHDQVYFKGEHTELETLALFY